MVPACDVISAQMGELFSCSQVNGYVRVRTPFLYPDGDVIDLFLYEKAGVLGLTDLGETTRWLRSQTTAPRMSIKQRQLIEDTCLTHGVETFKGMLTLRVDGTDQLASATMRLAQAALRVSDLWFTFRTRAVEAVTDDVAEFLSEKEIPFEKSEKIVGRSGAVWRVDFHTRHPRRSALVHVLSTGSRAAANGIADHVVASWYDLNHLKLGPAAVSFVSLFNDTLDVWSDENIRRVGDISEVSYWSRPDEFLEKIAA